MRFGIAALLAALLAAPPLAAQESTRAPREAAVGTYLEAARATARWLEACAVETEHGLRWPTVAGESGDSSTTLYSGSPGIVLFFLELHRTTGEAQHLELARRGADELAATFPARIEGEGAGLYTGVSGVGFTLTETWRNTGEERHRAAAARCSDLLHAAAVDTEHGAKWSDTTDVIAGAAGTGLWLLASAERLDRPQDRALAARAGRELLARAREEPQGLSWAMDPSFPRTMPNFSHGTAGVAYFLATLYAATGDEEFLTAARAGARHLLAIADRSDGGLRIHHHTPGGEELFYLGWCHGPAGTARLFQRLRESTGDEEWRAALFDSARAIRASGIPEVRPEGFWNNVGQCCGSAGVAEFFLALHRLDGEEEQLAFACRLADDLLARASEEAGGLRWIQAEHRVRPELLQAQTGYMQGAAGIGLLLLHLHARSNGSDERIRLPDDPF